MNTDYSPKAIDMRIQRLCQLIELCTSLKNAGEQAGLNKDTLKIESPQSDTK